MILVTGATGTIGGYLVDRLCRAGAPVRALVRSPERADVLNGYDCHTAIGRFEDPDSLDAALEGVDRVFLASPAGPEQARLEGQVVEAVRRAGGPHVVKLAALGVDDPASPVRILQQHREVVSALEGVPHTVLAPNGFFQNLLASAASVQQGVLPAAAGDAAVSLVDGRDVAAVAAHVLTTDGHEGATYTVTGPVAVTGAEVAAALSELLGREVTARDVGPDDLRGAMQGADPWLVEGLVELNQAYRAGAGAVVTDEVRKATGEPARPVEAFLRDHLAAFR